MEASLRNPAPYFVNPIVDAIFVCGGLPWILGIWFYFHPPAQAMNGQFLVSGAMLLILTHLFNNAHVGATWVRMYSSKESRQRFRFISVWLALGMVCIAATSLYMPALSAGMMKVYLVGVLQHYIAQAYGVAMIYCGRNNFVMTEATRRWLKLSVTLLSVWMIANEFSPLQVKFYFISTPYLNFIPMWAIIVLRGLFFISAILFAANLLTQSLSEKRLPPWTFMLILISIYAFMVIGAKVAFIWLIGPPLFHASQYLVVSGEYIMREKGIQARWTLYKNSFVYSVSAVVFGFFGYHFLPEFLESSGFQAALAAVYAPMSIHHFIADRAMWRLRDPKTRAVAVG